RDIGPILVVLESALQRDKRPQPSGRRSGFDPCCPGIRPSAPDISTTGRGVWCGFDPCCPGIRPSAGEHVFPWHDFTPVSILVVLESALQLAEAWPYQGCVSEFRSLLSWNPPFSRTSRRA